MFKIFCSPFVGAFDVVGPTMPKPQSGPSALQSKNRADGEGT